MSVNAPRVLAYDLVHGFGVKKLGELEFLEKRLFLENTTYRNPTLPREVQWASQREDAYCDIEVWCLLT